MFSSNLQLFRLVMDWADHPWRTFVRKTERVSLGLPLNFILMFVFYALTLFALVNFFVSLPSVWSFGWIVLTFGFLLTGIDFLFSGILWSKVLPRLDEFMGYQAQGMTVDSQKNNVGAGQYATHRLASYKRIEICDFMTLFTVIFVFVSILWTQGYQITHGGSDQTVLIFAARDMLFGGVSYAASTISLDLADIPIWVREKRFVDPYAHEVHYAQGGLSDRIFGLDLEDAYSTVSPPFVEPSEGAAERDLIGVDETGYASFSSHYSSPPPRLKRGVLVTLREFEQKMKRLGLPDPWIKESERIIGFLFAFATSDSHINRFACILNFAHAHLDHSLTHHTRGIFEGVKDWWRGKNYAAEFESTRERLRRELLRLERDFDIGDGSVEEYLERQAALSEASSLSSPVSEPLDYRNRTFNPGHRDWGAHSVPQAQGFEDVFDKVGDGLRNVRYVHDSPFARSFRKLITAAVAIPILAGHEIPFTPERFDLFDQEYIARARGNKVHTHLILDGLEAIHFFFKTGYAFFTKGCSLDTLLHTGDKYVEWRNEVTWLKANSHLSRADERDVQSIENRHSYRKRLEECIKRGKIIAGILRRNKDYAASATLNIVQELELMMSSIALAESTFRPKTLPYATYVWGLPGIGKSEVSWALHALYASVNGLPHDPGMIYCPQAGAKHEDGYDPVMWGLTADEIGNYSPEHILEDHALNMLFQHLSTMGRFTNQAALEKKGNTPFNVSSYVANGNTQTFGVEQLFNNPAAALRRFRSHIEVHAKEEFLVDGRLDSAHVAATGGSATRAQLYTVRRSVNSVDQSMSHARRLKQVTWRIVEHDGHLLERVEWAKVESFLRADMADHARDQQMMRQQIDNVMLNGTCKWCGFLGALCGCPRHCSTCLAPNTRCECQSELQGQSCSSDVTIDLESNDSESTVEPVISWGDWVYATSWYLKTGIQRRVNWTYESVRQKTISMALRWFAPEGGAGFQWAYWTKMRECERRKDRAWKYYTDWRDAESAKLIGERAEYYATRENGFRRFEPIVAVLGLLLVGGTAAAIVVAYKRRQEKTREQMIAQALSKGIVPSADLIARKFAYKRQCREPLPLGLSKSVPIEQAAVNFARQVALVKFCRDSEGASVITQAHALNFRGQEFLTTAHLVPHGDFWVIVDRGLSDNPRARHVATSSVWRDEERDLCSFRVIGLDAGRDIREYFATAPLPAVDSEQRVVPYAAVMLHRPKTGYSWSRASGHKHSVQGWEYFHKGKSLFATGYKLWSAGSSYSGLCGAPYLAETNDGLCVLGIHTAGKGNSVIVREVTQELFKEIEYGGFVPSYPSQGEPCEPLASAKFSTPPDKSWVNDIPGDAQVFGDVEGMAYARPSHHVHDSILRPHLAKCLGPEWVTDHGPPQMVHAAGNKAVTPYHHASLGTFNVALRWDTGIYQRCADALFEHWRTALGSKLKQLVVYDQTTAINGAPGVYAVERLPTDTSAGWPWMTKKKNLSERDGDTVTFVAEIQAVYDEMRSQLERGEVVDVVFKANLKDEPVSQKKRESGKTRVFSSGQWPWNVLFRQFFLSGSKLVQENPVVFGMLLGVDPCSYEWEEVHASLARYGDCAIAGDWSAYDKTVGAAEIQIAFEVMIKLFEASGNFTKDDLRACRALASGVSNPLTIYRTLMARLDGSNPSGHPWTTLINGVINWLRFMYAYTVLSSERGDHKSPSDFFSDIGASFQGDDNMLCSRPSVVEWFNGVELGAFFDRFGVKYTDAAKEGDLVKWRPLKEATIIKRGFRRDPETGFLNAPCEQRSLAKMLNVRMKGEYTAEHHAVVAIRNVLREYYQYGREAYTDLRLKLENLARTAGLWMVFENVPLPTFDEAHQEMSPKYTYHGVFDAQGHEQLVVEATSSDFRRVPAASGLVDPLTDQWTVVCKYEWQVGRIQTGSVVYPWRELFTNPGITGFLTNVAYLSADIEFKVAGGSTPGMYGSLMVAYEPLACKSSLKLGTVASRHLPTCIQFSQMRHVELTMPLAQTATFTAPLVHPSGWTVPKSEAMSKSLGALYIIPHVALQRTRPFDAEGVYISVHARLRNVRYKGFSPGISVPLSTLEPTPFKMRLPEPELAGRESGKVEKRSMRERARDLEFASRVQSFQTGISGAGAALAQGDGADERAPTGPRADGVGSVEPWRNDFSVSSLGSRYCLFFDAEWTGQNPGDALARIGVTPNTAHAFDEGGMVYLLHSPLSWISRAYRFWSGTVVYKVVVVASAQHSGVLQISWRSFDEIAAGPVGAITTTMDIGSTRSVEVRVPFQAPTAVLETQFGFVDRDGFTSAAHYVGNDDVPTVGHVVSYAMNGVLTIAVDSPLRGPAGAAATVCVYVKGGEDLSFSVPQSSFSHDELSDGSAPWFVGGDDPFERLPQAPSQTKLGQKMKAALDKRRKHKSQTKQEAKRGLLARLRRKKSTVDATRYDGSTPVSLSPRSVTESDDDYEAQGNAEAEMPEQNQAQTEVADAQGVATMGDQSDQVRGERTSLYELVRKFHFYSGVGVADARCRPQDESEMRVVRYVQPIFPLFKGAVPGALHEVDGKRTNQVHLTSLSFFAAGFAGVAGSVRWRIQPMATDARLHHVSVNKASRPPLMADGWYEVVRSSSYTSGENMFSNFATYMADVMDGGFEGGTSSSTGDQVEVKFEMETAGEFRYARRANPWAYTDDGAAAQWFGVTKMFSPDSTRRTELWTEGDLLWCAGGENLRFLEFVHAPCTMTHESKFELI